MRISRGNGLLPLWENLLRDCMRLGKNENQLLSVVRQIRISGQFSLLAKNFIHAKMPCGKIQFISGDRDLGMLFLHPAQIYSMVKFCSTQKC